MFVTKLKSKYMKQSIGSFAKLTIVNNKDKSNEEILQIVKKEFPSCKTTVNCIAWYKSDMKKKKEDVTIVKERTIELIQEELEESRMKVLELEEELELLKVTNRSKLEAEFERLKKLLEV